MDDDGFQEATYRLAHVDGGALHFAKVTVAVSTTTHAATVVPGTAPFAWRKSAYGPYAYALDTDVDHLAEALDGARLALRVVSRDVLAVVTEICTNVDTWPGDVRYAAGHALWRAVGVDRPALCVVRKGLLVFPDDVS
ncbi:hypothetical protein [Promicromonospora sp. NFX87]|uniref:hypothetical protein n=1 Tax=Promicromonospora sp. NFX87 TaxID=3402691 RepID=UPI003AFA9972